MTINRDKLVKLLVEKTDMSVSDVETQLDELINRIIDAARRGKALEIKGFGLFYFDEEGELSFKPSDQLDKEINFQYAGMEPVELKPGKPASKPAAEEKKKDIPKPPPSGEEKPVTKKTEEAPKEEAGDDVYGIGKTLSQQGDGDDDSDSDPFGKLFQKESSGIKPQKKKEIRKAGTTPRKKPAASATSTKKPAGKKKDPLMMVILIILAIVAVPVGYIIFTEYLSAPETTTEQTQQTIEPTEPPVTADADVTETEEPVTLDEVEATEPATVADEAPDDSAPDTESETERYGLMGEIADAGGDEFSIVVHSFQTRNQAERTAEILRQEGYRTTVTERTVNDRIVYRVGIGQFPSVSAAQNEAETLPEPYRNQNFIQRIQ